MEILRGAVGALRRKADTDSNIYVDFTATAIPNSPGASRNSLRQEYIYVCDAASDRTTRKVEQEGCQAESGLYYPLRTCLASVIWGNDDTARNLDPRSEQDQGKVN